MRNLKTLITLFLLVIGTNASWAIDDFEIDLMQQNPTLPAGVETTNDGAHSPYFNGGHGWANYVFKFTTTETVKITMQKCYYGGNACVKDAVKGNVLGELDAKQTETNCNGEVSWTYVSDGTPKDLYVHCGDYCHKVKVEKLVAANNFEINLVTTAAPSLPAGVKQISYPQNGVNYRNGDSHGTSWYAVEFDVDGPVDITLGGCQYVNSGYEAYLADASGNKIADIPTKTTSACGDVTYQYKGEGQTLKLYCGQYCSSVKVKEHVAEVPVLDERTIVWNWMTAKQNSQLLKETNIISKTGVIHSTFEDAVLEVDASSGKFDVMKSGNVFVAQMTLGVAVKVPVRSAGDEITVVSTSNGFTYTVAGVDANSRTTIYTATESDAQKGYVSIVAFDNNAKLYSITVKQIGTTAPTLAKIKLNAAGWGSYTCLVPNVVLSCPAGAAAYVATEVDGEIVTLTKVNKFAYGEGVFVKGEPNTQILPVIVEGASDIPSIENITEGCVEDVELYTESGAYVVATNNATGIAGFFRVTGNNIIVPAGKAYLYGPVSAGTKMLKFVFADGEEATGMESVAATKVVPTVFYNLAGQKVGKDYKGIVIGNDGMKYVK